MNLNNTPLEVIQELIARSNLNSYEHYLAELAIENLQVKDYDEVEECLDTLVNFVENLPLSDSTIGTVVEITDAVKELLP